MRSHTRHPPCPAATLAGILRIVLIVLAVMGPACANRGMNHFVGDASVDGSGGVGAGGQGSGGTGSGGTGSGGMGSGGMGSGGAIDMASDPVDAADARDSADARDASTDHPCAPADFPFETTATSEHVTTFPPPAINAVKNIGHSTMSRYCGMRSLELTTMFAPDTTRGEVLIDVPVALQNLTGKTITVRVSASPPLEEPSYVAVTLVTASGFLTLSPTIRALTADWLTQDLTIPMGGDAGVMMVTSIAIQVFDLKSYSGKIYVDDLDIR
jgi:hypothetical protein